VLAAHWSLSMPKRRKRNTSWKKAEQRVATLLGGEDCKRTPMSGSVANHFRPAETKNDTNHPTLHIEVKQRQRHGVWAWYRKAKSEAEAEARYHTRPVKTPVVALDELRAKGSIVCVHSDDLEEFCKNFLATRQRPKRKAG
jgi:phosphoglycolate phosphatase-like HAD superfamily hydrolase